jgi:integrase
MSYPERRNGELTGKWVGERRIDGARRRVRCLTKAEANKWEAYVDRHGQAPLDGTGATVKHSLGAVAKEARAKREGWKGSHDTSLDQRLEGVLHFFGPLNAVETITKERLCAFVELLEGRKGRFSAKLSGKTINRYLAVVSAMLDFARECGWTTHTVNMPWQEEDEGRIEFLQRDEEEAIAKLLSADERNVLRLLTLTGMRAGEFFTLDAAQVETAGNQCSWIRLRGVDTKSGKGRSIPLHDLDLARWLKASIVAGTLPSHESFYRSFKGACARLGYSDKLNVHSLRHTTATRLATKVKPAQVQDFMGHGSYKTTQKYIHLTDEDRMAAAAALA